MVPNIQPSLDFVVARLHGIMANAIKGDALEKLAHSTTEEVLRRNLKSLGIDCKSRTDFHNFIYNREAERLEKVARLLPGREAAFYRALQARSYFDNVKLALHWRYSRGEREAADLSFHIVQNMPQFNADAMKEAKDSHAFLISIPPYNSFNQQSLSAIIQGLEESGDLMLADSEIDHAYFRQLWEAARGMRSSIGQEACRLLGIEIDIINLTSLMRNALTYSFEPSAMYRLWLEHGWLYGRRELEELAKKGSLPEIRAALHGKYARVLANVGNDMHLVENALWEHFYQEAHHSFLAIENPRLCTAAYPFLVCFETLNLGRLYEGIYFGIPSHNILDIMLGVG